MSGTAQARNDLPEQAEGVSGGASKATVEHRARKHLVFSVADERFCLPLSVVKEVISVPQISALPQVSRFVKGLINLRGQIITVIDSRMRLKNLDVVVEGEKNCIIIVDCGELVMGLIVDDVHSVLALNPNDIESELDLPGQTRGEFVRGATRDAQGGMILVLNCQALLSHEQLVSGRRRSGQ